MSLNTEFNVTPYFDDFDEEKNFHRVLFKPSVAVQARELTQLQTILQNQIERFGTNVLNEGTIIQGGNFVEETPLPYVKVLDNNTNNQTINVTNYIGATVTGSVTGISAVVITAIQGLETQSPDLNTLYVRYLDTNDNGIKVFNSNENLEVRSNDGSLIETITVAGSSDPSPIGNGYGVRCGDGIIFQKGNFIRFENDITVVSKYDTNPTNIVVGFRTEESIVNSDIDTSLLDNANGFNNENAPGADRIQLTPILTALSLEQAEDDESFFALQEYQNGNVIRRRLTTQYNLLEKLIEKRDFELDGNSIIEPFALNVEESKTSTNNDLAIVIGPGIAYVEGKRVELVNNFQIDFERATTTDTAENQEIVANYGHYVNVENLKGFFDINTFGEVNLVDDSSTTIGTANIRSLINAGNGLYRAYIFNIQMNSGETFNSVRSIENPSGNASVDVIVSSANTANIEDFSFKRSVFDVGRDNIESFDLTRTDYFYRAANTSLETSDSGVITIELPAGDIFPYTVGSTLNETQKRDIILTAGETINPYTEGDLIDITGNSALITVTSSTQLTVELQDANTHPDSAMTTTGYYTAKRPVTSVNEKSVEQVYVKIDTATNQANTTGSYSLGFPDVIEIEGIWRVDANTAYSESGEDVTNNFTLFSNQKDTFYNLSYIVSSPNFTINSGDKFLVKVKTFRKTNAQNSFFTVNSYPVDDVSDPLPNGFIRTEQIPVYETESGVKINLRDAIDFRPYVSNTASYSSTISSATENPSDQVNFGNTNLFFSTPNRSVETTYDYYLGRIDRLIIDEYGDFNIIRGVPSTNPTAPEQPKKGMSLATITLRPFPSIPIGTASRIDRDQNAVFIERNNIRNYTSIDIEKLENRIRNLEEYTSLSLLEKSATDLTILDENGLDRFKNGILVDNFENLSVAKIDSTEFSASIDPAYKEIMPRFRSYPLDLVVERSNNVTDYGQSAILDHDEQPVINQSTATNTRSLTTNFWKFNGNITLTPDSDTTTDVTRAPDVNFNLDLTAPFTEFTEAINEFIPLQNISSDVVSRNTTTSTTGRTVTTTTSETIETLVRQIEIGGEENTQNLGDFVTDFNFNPFLRSRELQVQIFGLRPNTDHYFYFDRVNVDENVASGALQNGVVVRNEGFSNQPIRSNQNGELFAIFRIPAETFFVGDRELEIADVSIYNDIENSSSYASRTYHGYNVSVSKTNLTSTTRIPEPNVSTSVTRTTNTTTRTRRIAPPRRWPDPLAQTFIIDPDQSSDSSIYLSAVDLYFATKSETNGCTVEIREVDNGYPSGVSIPFSQVHLDSSEITANNQTATNATNVKFDSPIALKTNLEYAIVIKPDANDPNYRIWISRTGETDVDTNISVNQDTNAGVIFTSTNDKTWTPYQDENLKFTLYKAEFTSNQGSITLTNPNNEFLKLSDESSANFLENESVYIDAANTYLTGNVSFEAGNTTITGIGTEFSNEYEIGEHIVINDSNANTQVLQIQSIANNTSLTVNDIPLSTGQSQHFKTVTGIVSYYNSKEPKLLIVDNSSAKPGLTFANNDVIVGVESGATATVESVDDLPVSYFQANVFRNNFTKTSTSLTANRLYNGATSYSKDANFNDNNYLVSKQTFVRSRSNEVNEDAGLNSFELTIDLNTTSNDTSPFIDHAISNVTLYENFINNNSTLERTFYGEAESKYVSKKVELADGLDAEDIRVFLTAYRPPGTDIEVWAKFQASEDPNEFDDCACVAWTKLEKREQLDSFSSTGNRFDFREIEYVLGDEPQQQGGGAYLDNGVFTYTDPQGAIYNNYKFFAIKIVFLSNSHNLIPRVRDMRAIALS